MRFPFHPPSAILAGILAALLLTGPLAQLFAGASGAVEQESGSENRFPGRLPITELSEDQAILHALNRLGFGPRPDGVERVRQMGLERWIEQQLNPETIDDAALVKRLERFPTLKLSSTELLEKYPQPQQVARQAGMTPEQLSQLREQMQQRRQERNSPGPGTGPTPGGMRSSDDQTDERMGPPDKTLGLAAMAAAMRDAPRPQQIIQELSAAKLTRAIYSERQLQELLTDFWFNHFNVFAGKGADRWLLTSYERDTIRPHVLGKFQDLLIATAKSPAMQFYLDNWQSADPEAFDRMQQQQQARRQRLQGRFGMGMPAQRPNPQRRRGLNENYARELMELHTLGVEGGYTQKDVAELARVFTGWTIRQPRRNPEFYFEARLHDPGTKVVLGKKIRGGGMREGEQVLEMLAHHPSTARFLSTKLAQRFVSDQPPASLVDRMTAAYQKSDGDIRTVMRAMIYSPEFWSRESYRAKIKKPLELVASTVRAAGFDGDVPPGLVEWTARLGEPLYQCQPPTGYSDQAEAWVNTGALLNRMNFALQVTTSRPRVSRAALQGLLGNQGYSDPQEILTRFIQVFLGGEVSGATRQTLESQLEEVLSARTASPYGPQRNSAAEIAGLVLGSPEFQRR
ncbi:MAG: DUF1800 domain-containing protein [Acidobacteria bacterium]|nr:DUF1800 domain-containing protein [Acidobacteriota bacterium]